MPSMMTCGRNQDHLHFGMTKSSTWIKLLAEIPWIMSWRNWARMQSCPRCTQIIAFMPQLCPLWMRMDLNHATLCMWHPTRVKNHWNPMVHDVQRRKEKPCSRVCPTQCQEWQKKLEKILCWTSSTHQWRRDGLTMEWEETLQPQFQDWVQATIPSTEYWKDSNHASPD